MPKKTKDTKKNNQIPPQWQPIAQLPLLTTLIDGMLESANEQYKNLHLARQKPHVLDDYTVGRVITVFTSQQNDLSLYDEQVQRWRPDRNMLYADGAIKLANIGGPNGLIWKFILDYACKVRYA